MLCGSQRARCYMENGYCPDQAELAKFVTGNLCGKAFQRIAQHVENCSACETALAELDDPNGSFLSQLRQAALRDLSDADPVPEELLASARSFGVEDRSRGGSPVTGPRQLGKFELLEELGVGSFGHVFRARDTELGRTVAIKLLRAGRLASREELDRFVREARSAAQLQHPGLVALHETGQSEEGLFYLVEEFVQGETLTTRLKAGRF